MEKRSPSNFPEAVRQRFGFLEHYGFACVFRSESKVRYESTKAYVEISHGEWDSEIALSFGRIATEEKFSFTLFLRLKNPALEMALGERLAVDAAQVETCLGKLADALQSEGEEILGGDESVFEQMKDVRWWHFQPDALKKSSEHRPLE